MLSIVIAIIVNKNPQDISIVGVAEYIANPNINAAKGSAPDSNMDDTPESICFKLTVENIYGNAKENVECIIRNITDNDGLILIKSLI